MNSIWFATRIAVFALAIGVLMITGCSVNGGKLQPEVQAQIDSLQAIGKAYAEGISTSEKNLATFDTLDYIVFSNQEWVRLHESHHQDIIVNWPDGHATKGIERHIEDLKAMFVYAPDTRIKQHPIRFADKNGEWSCVTGIFEGTFTKPMPIGGGKSIPPTGKAFRLPMCTVGHWSNGVMIEESLFWDNQTFMKQVGLAK